MRYSVVIPVFNEAQNLSLLYPELKAAMDGLGEPYELIFINDGSTDASLNILQQLQAQDGQMVLLSFKANSGQAQALQAGFNQARGEIIISLDADRQNDPRDIPRLLERLTQGNDLVCGWRRQRQDGFLKKAISRLGNRCQRLFLGAPVHDISCTLKAFRRVCLKEFTLKENGQQCLFPFALQKKGYKISEVVIRHRPRMASQSKFGLGKLARDVVRAFFALRFAR